MKFMKRTVAKLILELDALCREAQGLERKHFPELSQVDPRYTDSARNLIHYLAFRHHDLRGLQRKLADLGVSQLEQIESHVQAGIMAARDVLRRSIGVQEIPAVDVEPSITNGAERIQSNTNALLGKKLKGSTARIMVTLSTEMAEDQTIVRKLVVAGMSVARINCAHDNPEIWMKMVENIRNAQEQTGRSCKICMDLAGAKLRTGPITPGPNVVRLRPKRDSLGYVTSPCTVWLAPPKQLPPSMADVFLPMPSEWLKKLRKGDKVRFQDARGKQRVLKIGRKGAKGRWAECYKSAYVTTGTVLTLYKKHGGEKAEATKVLDLPAIEQRLKLKAGNTLIIHQDPRLGEPAEITEAGIVTKPAHLSCPVPEVYANVKSGEPIMFDDGKIEGKIRSVTTSELHVEITKAKHQGSNLASDKGINLPASTLRLGGLTAKDKEDLRFIAQHADIVNVSFVNDPADILAVIEELNALNVPRLGLILKIETLHGFRNLPLIILAAMRCYPVGVMIARGDLAAECGYEQLAEIQEEILWICEAAHLPVIWATEVLENLAQKGSPTRAEITDAAMAERAECVMLNKGPYILQAIHTLDNILQRMETYQRKKRSILRPLTVAEHFQAHQEDKQPVGLPS